MSILGHHETAPSLGRQAMAFSSGGVDAYLFGGDHDTNLLNSLSEFFRFDSTVVVQIKVFEGLHQDGLFALRATRLL